MQHYKFYRLKIPLYQSAVRKFTTKIYILASCHKMFNFTEIFNY